MCEEEDSSMDEDEDMPGLESVSSSEVRGPCVDMVCSFFHFKSGRSPCRATRTALVGRFGCTHASSTCGHTWRYKWSTMWCGPAAIVKVCPCC